MHCNWSVGCTFLEFDWFAITVFIGAIVLVWEVFLLCDFHTTLLLCYCVTVTSRFPLCDRYNKSVCLRQRQTR